MRLEITDPAAEEIAEAFDWYSKRSQQAARRFLDELGRAFDSVLQSPGTWPKFESETRRFVLKRFPFSVIYLQTEEMIEVVALAHHKRLPGYWSRR